MPNYVYIIPMTLQQLNNKIHSIPTPTELSTELASIKSDIKTILSAGGGAEENYYKNHTGRELFRKLNNFDMAADLSSIGDPYDSGFRPTDVAGIKA
jgi:hypothetical protein